jgi:uncharacterized protein (TIGR02145 family)
MFRSKILVGSLVTITSLSALVLTSTTANAEGEPYSETYTKSALIRVTTSCTMSGTVNTPHLSTISAGSYAEITGETEISTVCNDNGGFAVYAIGFTNDTDGKNVMTNGTAANDIATGTARTGETSNWAMKLTAVQDGDNTPTIENGYSAFSVVPNSYVKVASYPSVTAPSKEVAFTTHYAAYISMSQPAGTYEGQVKYVMVHPASASPEPDNKDPLDPEKDITKGTNHPCMNLGDGSTCDDTDGDGVGDTLVFPGNSLLRAFEIAYTTAEKPMYIEDANTDIGWRPMVESDYATVGGKEVRFAMQDIKMTLDGTVNGTKVCAAAASSVVNVATHEHTYVDEGVVMDLRDGKSYWIAKLADGRCWMTQNLDLDLIHENNDANARYTHDNTDIGWGSDTSTMSWNPAHSTGALSSFVFSYGSPTFSPYSVDVGDWYWIGNWNNNGVDTYYRTTSYRHDFVNDGADQYFSQTPFAGNGAHGHVGNYYNWAAAVASNDVSAYTTSTFDTPANSPQNSICPAGWRMPLITTYQYGAVGNNEYNNLYWLSFGYNSYNGFDDYYLTAAPFYYVRAGLVAGETPTVTAGREGYYRSNAFKQITTYDRSAYVANFQGYPNGGYVYVDNQNSISSGLSVRCIAR